MANILFPENLLARFSACTFFLCIWFFTSPLPAIAENSITADGVRVLLIPHVETVLSGEISARIEDIKVDFGDQFLKGQLLVRLDCRNFQSELRKAEALLREAEKTLEVYKRLDKLGSISELEVAAAASRIDQAKAVAAINTHQVSKCSVHAPFAGGVAKRIANPHQYITPGLPLLKIIDTKNIDLQIHIPSKWLEKIRISTPFSVYVEEVGKQYNGVVTAIGASIDPVSRTIEIRGEIPGENSELLAGMSGSAQFDLK